MIRENSTFECIFLWEDYPSFFTRYLKNILPSYSIENDDDLEKELGIEFYYNNDRKDQGDIFSGFRLLRRGEKNSNGFQGVIPLNMNFSMPLEEIIQTVGASPNKEDQVGMFKFYTWYLSEYILYINYDLIDNRPVTFTFYGLFMEE